MTINGVTVVDGLGCSEDEIKAYIKHVEDTTKGGLTRLAIAPAPDGEGVILDYVVLQRKFERIRRVTGYLTGDLKSWNNAKQAEERERVKHA